MTLIPVSLILGVNILTNKQTKQESYLIDLKQLGRTFMRMESNHFQINVGHKCPQTKKWMHFILAQFIIKIFVLGFTSVVLENMTQNKTAIGRIIHFIPCPLLVLLYKLNTIVLDLFLYWLKLNACTEQNVSQISKYIFPFPFHEHAHAWACVHFVQQSKMLAFT